jgi:hypothetical protein
MTHLIFRSESIRALRNPIALSKGRIRKKRNLENDEGRNLNDQEEDSVNIAEAGGEVEEFEEEEEEREEGGREAGQVERDGQGGKAEAEDDTGTDTETIFRTAGEIADDENDGQDSE